MDQIPHPTPNHAQLSHRPTSMPASDFRFPAWPEVNVRMPGAGTNTRSTIPTGPFHVKHAYTSVLRNTHTWTEPRITRKSTLGPAVIHHTITHGPRGGFAAGGSLGCWPLSPQAMGPDRTLGPYGPDPALCPRPFAARSSSAPASTGCRLAAKTPSRPSAGPPEHPDTATPEHCNTATPPHRDAATPPLGSSPVRPPTR